MTHTHTRILALALVGIGSNKVEFLTGEVKLWDNSTESNKLRVHHTPNAKHWVETDNAGNVLRHGLLTHANTVTVYDGHWPNLNQTVLPFGGYVYDEVTTKNKTDKVLESHPLQKMFTEYRFGDFGVG